MSGSTPHDTSSLGAQRFEDFKTTGIKDNILSARLRRLVDGGIF